MKRLFVLLTLATLLLLTGMALAQSGVYDLSWWTADGGGAIELTAGDYALGGTVGQPDAGVLKGGGYTLSGGFWGGKAGPGEHAVYLPLVLRAYP